MTILPILIPQQIQPLKQRMSYGRYRDLIGSGPFTFSVVSNPEAGQVTDPGGTDHNQDPATGGTGESVGIGFYARSPRRMGIELEIEAGDGEDVDILSFEGGRIMESDEQGDYSVNLELHL